MLAKESLVLRSRVRLARNLKLVPFPHRLESERARMLVKAVEEAFYVSKVMEDSYATHRMWELGRTELLWLLKNIWSARSSSTTAIFLLTL